MNIVNTTLNICIGAIIENPQMLKFVPDQDENKNMCKHTVKKLSFVIKYASVK